MVVAMKRCHCLFYFQQYFSALRTVLPKSFTGVFPLVASPMMFVKFRQNLYERYRDILG